jgi:hypothetical protein
LENGKNSTSCLRDTFLRFTRLCLRRLDHEGERMLAQINFDQRDALYGSDLAKKFPAAYSAARKGATIPLQ